MTTEIRRDDFRRGSMWLSCVVRAQRGSQELLVILKVCWWFGLHACPSLCPIAMRNKRAHGGLVCRTSRRLPGKGWERWEGGASGRGATDLICTSSQVELSFRFFLSLFPPLTAHHFSTAPGCSLKRHSSDPTDW